MLVRFALLPALCLCGFAANAEGLRAGAARIDVTPTQPVAMAGYGSRTNLSQGVHDPLSARALAFEQDGARLVLVSLDSLGFYNQTAEPLRQAILDANGLKPSELLLCAIHTHSAPTLTLDLDHGPARERRLHAGPEIKTSRRGPHRAGPAGPGANRPGQRRFARRRQPPGTGAAQWKNQDHSRAQSRCAD